ncbi:MAG: polysaccharide deacetylase family protein [Acidobacteriota bacterium]
MKSRIFPSRFRRRTFGLVLLLSVACACTAATIPPHRRKPLWPLKAHPVVALTFDDVPSGGGLPAGDTRAAIVARLVKTLQANHLQGVYGFVVGSDLQDDADVRQALRAWVAAGMMIGNHTWSHPSLNSVSAEEFERQILLDEPFLSEYATGRDWHWFRYPYLEEGDTLAKRNQVRAWLREHSYRIAEVTLNFNDDDWSDPYNRCLAKNDAAAVAWLQQSYLDNAAEFIRLGREEEQLAFGHEIPNVLLLHETAFTTLMLPRLLELLRREGFRFAPLARVERNRAYSLDPAAGLPEGGPLTNQFLNSRHIPYPRFQPEPEQRLNSLCQ